MFADPLPNARTYSGTLSRVLAENQIRNPVFQKLFLELYIDYLHVALHAMGIGVAA